MVKTVITRKISTPEELDNTSSSTPTVTTPEVSEEELLSIAQGVESSDKLGFEEKFWEDVPSSKRDIIRFRREVRRGIYKILKYNRLNKDWKENPRLVQLYDIINPQMTPNLGIRWETFADRWDIHPKEPLKIIIKEHWIKEGGGFDVDLGYHYPHAFTKQSEG